MLLEGGDEFLARIEEMVESPHVSIQLHSLYILSSISAGSQKHKKIVLKPRFFDKAVLKLASPHANIRVAVLNLIANLVWKEKEGDVESPIRKRMAELSIKESLEQMKATERDSEVRTFVDRCLRKFN